MIYEEFRKFLSTIRLMRHICELQELKKSAKIKISFKVIILLIEDDGKIGYKTFKN